MKVIKASHEILTQVNGDEILKHIELCGRVCYKSEDKITQESSRTFVANILKRGHESVLEHYDISVRFICDRGVSHGIVRHRIASYSQESTRYVNYSAGKYGGDITLIKPLFFDDPSPMYAEWALSMQEAENRYNQLISLGASPQEARSVLPNSLKTEIICTMNLREWRHFFKLRTAKAAHPQMQEVTIPLLAEFKQMVPVVFDDIEVGE